MKTATVQRSQVILHPDRSRVLLRPFLAPSDPRAVRICAQVMALPETEVHALWQQVKMEFGERHAKTREFLKRRFEQVRPCLRTDENLSEERQLLLGAYFSHEYSLEAAALFNPSIVPHPDQSDLPPGSLRFILSLRATGEGHISSITFRTGLLDARSNITINAPTRYCLEPEQVPNASYEKDLFERKLQELGLAGDFSRQVLQGVGSSFTLDELRASLSRSAQQFHARDQETGAAARKILMLAQSNYEVQFAPDSRLSERVLFPVTPSQSNGIEDARFVRFQHEDGTQTYYATYTAYDGKMILPQFIETPDFLHFKFITLNGPAVQNKGMALFPRKINGHYAMLGRQDYENIYIMFSDHLHFWHATQLVLKPAFPVGVHPVGQLRLAHRDRRRLARAQPRRGADAQVLHRRVSAGPGRSDQGDRPPARAADQAQRKRARGLRAQRGLFLRQPPARPAARHPLRHVRLRHHLRHAVPGRGAGRDGIGRRKAWDPGPHA